MPVDATKNHDRGLLTRGMYQQTRAAASLQRFAEIHLGGRLDQIYRVITHLASLHVDEFVYRGYLEPLIQRTQLYPGQYWEPPQWLHVQDLELLAN